MCLNGINSGRDDTSAVRIPTANQQALKADHCRGRVDACKMNRNEEDAAVRETPIPFTNRHFTTPNFRLQCRMWMQRFSGIGALTILSPYLEIRLCAGALQVTTNITGSDINFKERLLIEWTGDSQSSHDVGVQQQSASENGSFVLLSGRFREREGYLALHGNP